MHGKGDTHSHRRTGRSHPRAGPACGDRIRALLPEMPLALARVADYLLRNPEAPLTLSIGELADQAGTSPATVTRFCRMLGFSGYVDLRIEQRHRRRPQRVTGLAGATEIGRGFGPDDSPEELLRMLIGGHTRTLREATSAIDLAVMMEVSRRIAVSAPGGHLRRGRQRDARRGAAGSALPDRHPRVRVVRGAHRPDQRGHPGQPTPSRSGSRPPAGPRRSSRC